MAINEPSETENWIEIPDRGNAKFHINQDKVIAKHGKDVLELTKEATDDIKTSLKKFPRKYLLGKQAESTYQQFLAKVGVKINNSRSAYITEFNKKQRTTAEKKELARLMRHSPEVADRDYRKLLDVAEEKVEGFNRQEWSKQYSKKNRKKLNSYMVSYYRKHAHDILRRKMLRELNTKGIKNPKAETLNKYKIYFDKKSNVYKLGEK